MEEKEKGLGGIVERREKGRAERLWKSGRVGLVDKSLTNFTCISRETLSLIITTPFLKDLIMTRIFTRKILRLELRGSDWITISVDDTNETNGKLFKLLLESNGTSFNYNANMEHYESYVMASGG